ncbi:polysaccharide deacetylase family protein [Polaribacter sp.]|uniref:polysaccharide deacetylase family protein n=2 Tax=Polaribacter sp. TaxID=1920175 RepID=UPI0040489BE3
MKIVRFWMFFLCFLVIKSNAKNVFEIKKDSFPFIEKVFLEHQKNSNGFAIAYGNLSKKEIALTFDDGPTEVSKEIIKILNKYHAKGTFFWVGHRIKNNEKIIQFARKNGHLIANHSWNHENGFSFSNEFLWESQVEKTLNEFSKYGITDVQYFRPPFGAITQNQIDFLATKNIKTVLWSITTNDWDPKENSDDLMFQKLKKNMHSGAIVLFHDFDYGNLDSKLKDLEKILIYGIRKGYKFVTVANLN